MTFNFNCIPNDVFHIIFSHLPLNDACQLSMTSRSYRSLFFSYLNLAEGDKISLRSLENRAEILSVPLLQQISILQKNSADIFFSLALRQVKMLQNEQLILSRLSENPADPQLLLQAAEKALKQGNVDVFIAIAKNPSLQTTLSFRAGEFSVMHHSQLLEFIIENLDLEALKQFVTLPAFAQIPCYEWIEQVDGEIIDIELAQTDLNLTDHIISLLDPEIHVDFDTQCAFIDILSRHDSFMRIPDFALGCILCSTLEENNLDIIKHTAKVICSRITSQMFKDAFQDYFMDDDIEQRGLFWVRLSNAMLELQITFRPA